MENLSLHLTQLVSSMDSEMDQLYKICCVLGTPDLTIFPEGTNISRLFGIVNFDKVSFCDDLIIIVFICYWLPLIMSLL